MDIVVLPTGARLQEVRIQQQPALSGSSLVQLAMFLQCALQHHADGLQRGRAAPAAMSSMHIDIEVAGATQQGGSLMHPTTGSVSPSPKCGPRR